MMILLNATYEGTAKLLITTSMIRFQVNNGKVTFYKVGKLTVTSVLSAIHRAICSAEKPRTCNSYVSPLLGFPFAGKLIKVGAEFMFS